MLRNVQNFAEIAQMLSKKHVQRFWNILPARIHVFSVPILTHQETVNGNSDRYDQYFQQLQELGPGSTCQYIVNS